MNRARRSAAVYKRATPKKKDKDDEDDDFESDGFEDDDNEDDDGDGDFSASEEEWLPGKDNQTSEEAEGEGTGTVSSGEDNTEEHESDEEDEGDGSGSDESVVASARSSKSRKRSSKSAPTQPPKKKRLSPASRKELYQRTKKYLLKESDPERPPLNSSVADILKLCQFQKKKDITNNGGAVQAAPKPIKKAATNKDDDSDSSGDEHLINPEKLDLNSKFFDKIEPQKGEVAPPQFDCNAGMRLSDSSDDDDDGDDARGEEALPASIQKSAADQLISKINEASSEFMNFNSLGEFNRKIEEAKKMLKNYQKQEQDSSSGSAHQEREEDVSNLLALGETEAGISPGKNIPASQNGDMSEESDWEEVEDIKKSQLDQKPPADYNITVEVATAKSKKKRWEEIEMELYIKRQINKAKRANQLAFHKSSVLCAIASGRALNEIVNSKRVQAMALSLMQSPLCVMKGGKADVKFVEQMIKWFKGGFTLTNQQVLGPKTAQCRFTLALEMFIGKITCKRNYVVLFLVFLRMADVQCRLVVSANVPPKRPAMKDLCPISERQLIEKFEKEFNGLKVEVKTEKTSPAKATDEATKMKEDTEEIVKIEDEKSSKGVKSEAKTKNGTSKKPARKEPKSAKAQETDEATPAKATDEATKVEEDAKEIAKTGTRKKSTRKDLESTDIQETVEAPSKKPSRGQTLLKVQVELCDTKTDSKTVRKSPRDSSSESSRKLRFSPEPDVCNENSKKASPSSKENAKPRKSILKLQLRSSPRVTGNQATPSTRKPLEDNQLTIPQLDGLGDLEAAAATTPKNVPISRRLRSRDAKASNAKSYPDSPFAKRATNTPVQKSQEKNGNQQKQQQQPGRVSKRKLFDINKNLQPSEPAKVPKQSKSKPQPKKNKILSTGSSAESSDEEEDKKAAPPAPTQTSPALSKKRQSRVLSEKKLTKQTSIDFDDDDDSDFEPPEKQKMSAKKATTTKARPEESPKSKKKNVQKSAKKVTTKKAVKEEEKDEKIVAGNKMDFWMEFYSEKDKRWITVDLFGEKIDCVEYLMRHATSPISYVFGFDNSNHIKDITPRYVQHWNTVSRKLRVEPKWLDKALKPFLASKTKAREKQEDAELNKIHIDKPLPTTITECKNHPLYVLKRHLLKFEALYPADCPALGFIRGEALYARECVFTLQTREKWYKEARVVKPFETAYKVVKCLKWDKMNNAIIRDVPCEIFGIWQTDKYDPPTAEDGKVPRNEYGNVELFKPCMLPKKTVHLKLPGLNRVCRRLGIDCAPALTGFEKARMRMIPVYDGFVVCEEFANQVVEEWYNEMDEEERREQERYEKRVYGNWKRLIKGLLVRRRLQNKYNFDNL